MCFILFLFFYFESFMCHSLFCSIAPYSFWHMKTSERKTHDKWMKFLFGRRESMFLHKSQCKSQHFICGCMWILIMGAWLESQQGSQQFDKT
jgi:hypothetical protein